MTKRTHGSSLFIMPTLSFDPSLSLDSGDKTLCFLLKSGFKAPYLKNEVKNSLLAYLIYFLTNILFTF